MAAERAARPWFDRLLRAAHRYRQRTVAYYALRVVVRGLFLAVSAMLAFLFILARVTSLLPGANEISIPTARVPADTDLGAIISATLDQSTGAVLDVVGAATLAVSAYVTARALREGTAEVLAAGDAGRLKHKRRFVRDALAGIGLAVAALVGWTLALATAIRTRALSRLLGVDLARELVPVGKALLVLASVLALLAALWVVMRRVAPTAPGGDVLLAATLLAAFVVGANFVMLYSYVTALLNPHTAGGVVLVLTLLAWVNLVVRGYFYTMCWLAEGVPAQPGAGVTESA